MMGSHDEESLGPEGGEGAETQRSCGDAWRWDYDAYLDHVFFYDQDILPEVRGPDCKRCGRPTEYCGTEPTEDGWYDVAPCFACGWEHWRRKRPDGDEEGLSKQGMYIEPPGMTWSQRLSRRISKGLEQSATWQDRTEAWAQERERHDTVILKALRHSPSASVTELEDLTGLPAPRISERLRQLEARGLVERANRKGHVGRAVLNLLTPVGTQFLDEKERRQRIRDRRDGAS